jgi:hypothetical protein
LDISHDSDERAEVRKPRVWLGVVSVCWLALTVGGLWVLIAYENRPGQSANAPLRWPVESGLRRDTTRATLIMLAHPQCSCTRASLGELAEVLARTPKPPKTYVVFLKPEGFSEEWAQTDLWRTATALPDVTVVVDHDGAEARRFGTATSGQTLLYDKSAALVFHGGITGARAHPGDNAGRATLIAALTPGARGENRGAPTNVFGCSLFAGAFGE